MNFLDLKYQFQVTIFIFFKCLEPLPVFLFFKYKYCLPLLAILVFKCLEPLPVILGFKYLTPLLVFFIFCEIVFLFG